LLDYWGNSPQSPAEAYVQYINGLPWNWLTRDDLIYEPFRKRPNSPYGLAPLETILLNANTDLRFQQYFLQKFTDGNVPRAFASAPESWSPQQIEMFQELWDATLMGDQTALSQVKWMPGGSKLEWSNDKEFQDHFSLFLMRKTASAYHVVPADLGFTETVNRSSGESQADVQHRVGDLPLLRHVQDILTAFLQDDLGLPLAFAFDLGEEQADRLQQAQADKLYVDMGAIGASDIREMRYGLPEPDGRPVPRYIYTTHAGPIPLASLYALAGDLDQTSGAPEPGTQLPHTVFGGAEGVQPSPPIKNTSLAEQEFGPSAMPTAPPPQPVADTRVAKDGEGAPTAGITTATGITGYDLIGQHDDEDDEEVAASDPFVEKQELQAFRTFRKSRVRAGKWRDFTFRTLRADGARELNRAGRVAVAKATGNVAVAGLAVQAADTGRVLMLQRALDPEDPAGGFWEVPGGHLEDGESPLQGAWREWSEEVHTIPPPGQQTGEWVSSNGIYQGIVWQVPSESFVSLDDRDQITNPDDPDSDAVEAIAWWDPVLLAGNPAVRPELLADLDSVMAALDGVAELEKAATDPKGDASDMEASTDWPGWELDESTADHWAGQIHDALTGVLPEDQAGDLAGDYLADNPTPADGEEPDTEALTAAAVAWLALRGLDFATPLAGLLPGLYADGYLIGLTAAHAVVDGGRPDLGGWTPGDTAAARRLVDGLGGTQGLTELSAEATSVAAEMAATRRRDLARALVKGLLAGVTVAALGNALARLLGRRDTAATIALTEVTRASGIAALLGYRQRDVTQVRWLTDPSGKVCPRCLANAGAGAVPLGAAFPSGATSVPQHPRCRCSVVNV
jgi:8-oxo-dGTP pyrophosphatase MutT (NUDIX family)